VREGEARLHHRAGDRVHRGVLTSGHQRREHPPDAPPPSGWWWRLLGLATALGAIAAVATTWHVFNHTFDEGVHLAAGLEWLELGRFTLEPRHPLLGRVAIALGPWLDGASVQHRTDLWSTGNAALYQTPPGYGRTLALARAGVLPFFAVATLLVWSWARRLDGGECAADERAGALAVLLFVTTPPVLAHAGLATTDMPLTATLTGALLAATRWIERPTVARATILGLACGLAVLAKLSGIPYLAAAGVALAACRAAGTRRVRGTAGDVAWRTLAVTAGIAGLVACSAILLAYGFSIARWRGVPIPLPPEIMDGLWQVRRHNEIGEGAYFLLGEWRDDGVWYYFPVAVAVKTPIPLLVLAGGGGVALLGRLRAGAWQPAAPLIAALAILAVAMAANINLGIRHVLPLYPLLAVVGARGALALWTGARRRASPLLAGALVVALLAWQVVTPALAHPDHLPWFNALAGAHPDDVLLDSNLDWGQDLDRLRDTTQALGVPALALAYFGSAEPARHGLPPLRPLRPGERTIGWVAVSQMFYHGLRPGATSSDRASGYRWLAAHGPPIRVGRSILLFRVPE
jgi:hypothetical protein